MAESVLKAAPNAGRKEHYDVLLPQVESLISEEPDLIANLANICAVLKETFDFLWIGFYIVKENELVLGPFQGPLACTRIGFGKGVCGAAWKEQKTILVPDVEAFPGHIACSSLSRSEIVVPVVVLGKVVMVLDVDSSRLSDFTNVDAAALEQLALMIATQALKNNWFA